jgi:hypothetical protein
VRVAAKQKKTKEIIIVTADRLEPQTLALQTTTDGQHTNTVGVAAKQQKKKTQQAKSVTADGLEPPTSTLQTIILPTRPHRHEETAGGIHSP